MNLNSRNSLWRRLLQGKKKRAQFVESHLNKGVAYQIRAIREKLGWSQERLAKEVGMPQNAISRLESPDYGRPSLTSLRRLAAAFDVGLVVRFVPFGQMVDWISGTPRVDFGLNTDTLAIANFSEELASSPMEHDVVSNRMANSGNSGVLINWRHVNSEGNVSPINEGPPAAVKKLQTTGAAEIRNADDSTTSIPRKQPGVAHWVGMVARNG